MSVNSVNIVTSSSINRNINTSSVFTKNKTV